MPLEVKGKLLLAVPRSRLSKPLRCCRTVPDDVLLPALLHVWRKLLKFLLWRMLKCLLPNTLKPGTPIHTERSCGR